MFVRKRNGSLEPLDINKIIRAVARCAKGIPEVDPNRVAAKTIGGLFDGATTQELDSLSISTAASFIAENANYSKLAASLLAEVIRKEVAGQGIETFSQSVKAASKLNLASGRMCAIAAKNARKLDNAIDEAYNVKFGYYGLRNVYDNLLLRHPDTGKVIETPQQYLMRRSVELSPSATAAIKFYHKLGLQDEAALEVVAALSQEIVTVAAAALEETIPFRPLMPGMGQVVAERTILRKDAGGKWENWGDVARRVALGNTLLAATESYPFEDEFRTPNISIADYLASGLTRHNVRDVAGKSALD
jgi:hypothetical protein